MAVRLRTRWHRSSRSERNREGSRQPKRREDLAGAVAFNIWKLAKDAFLHMEKEDFRFPKDSQAVDVIAEFSIFILHIIDRMIYGKVEEEERTVLINGIAKHLAQTFVDNQMDLLGPGDYMAPFIDKLNERLSNYAECGFDENGPGHDFMRYLGQQVAEIMAESDNKWVLEQVMDIEAPALAERIRPMVRDTLGIKE
jgi:hypothetical protein